MRVRRTLPPAAAPLPWSAFGPGRGQSPARDRLRRLEDEIGVYFGVGHVFLVSSGKAALALILRALRSILPGRDEVLIPAYTCYSVPSAVVKAGLRVRACDIDPSTLDYDPGLIGPSVGPRTLAVVADHLFGIPADVPRLRDICRERGSFLVEDAAQAMGGTLGGQQLGTLGDVGFFSFGRGKNVTCGAGGAIVTGSRAIAAALERERLLLGESCGAERLSEFGRLALTNVFIRPSLYWFPAQLPFLKLGETFYDTDFPLRRMSGSAAGLLRGWRKRLETSNEIRRENARHFREKLGVRNPGPEGVPYLRLPVLAASGETRDRMVRLAKEEGLGIGPLYPGGVDGIAELQGQFGRGAFPVAADVARRLFTIPTHPLLSAWDRSRICRFFERNGFLETRSEEVRCLPAMLRPTRLSEDGRQRSSCAG